eukprot:CAMPEP_0177227988 /NCGR_PEP_ID=MMETSP0367-20130122/40909_1 /TAXON_ID=447022 ORGANISM="Scrippsiella hangoei-like, Strain SHHI-4" /NCGR_SAMPLE_ID=MMETSP0367 /ASSEMBLY_ACC=CAM_ASM_000362 /LENGTH=50 /DNA_ID=CAMNT_0018678257 /DNA_START=1105 /DNA_END=1254 /DNA_ORIENTATION=-
MPADTQRRERAEGPCDQARTKTTCRAGTAEDYGAEHSTPKPTSSDTTLSL